MSIDEHTVPTILYHQNLLSLTFGANHFVRSTIVLSCQSLVITMLKPSLSWLFSFLISLSCIAAACISSGDQTTINQALSSGGAGTVVQLCPNTIILINDQINFTADNQELSTEGYPTDGTRATIKVALGSGVGTLVAGAFHSGVRLLNVQIDGDRPNNGLLKGDYRCQDPREGDC